MKKSIFKSLARINKIILPKYWNRDLTKLSLIDKAIVGYKIWVTKNSLN